MVFVMSHGGVYGKRDAACGDVLCPICDSAESRRIRNAPCMLEGRLKVDVREVSCNWLTATSCYLSRSLSPLAKRRKIGSTHQLLKWHLSNCQKKGSLRQCSVAGLKGGAAWRTY
jgi:hypothetical protein